MIPRLVSVNTNADKQFRKLPRSEAHLVANFGLEGDRHAGRPDRQVSILNAETVAELAGRGMPVEPATLGAGTPHEEGGGEHVPAPAHLPIRPARLADSGAPLPSPHIPPT